jgi:hypothetical protein
VPAELSNTVLAPSPSSLDVALLRVLAPEASVAAGLAAGGDSVVLVAMWACRVRMQLSTRNVLVVENLAA